ncbi:tRNA-dihydrouridine(47) synthase [NAD(P)(+)]-like [Gastrophryne carolinensis]
MAEGDNQNSENGKAANVAAASDRGVAPIKPQYITTKEKFHDYIDCDGKEGTKKKDAKQDDSAGAEDDSSCVAAEPPAKKVKHEDFTLDQLEKSAEDETDRKRKRGMNKSRPHKKYSHYEQQKLCPSIIQECASKCYFGKKCKFLHDAAEYLSKKPKDISPTCYLYQTFGKCMYGLKCRFAGSHLGEDFKNLANEEVASQWEGKVLVKNVVSKNLQIQLRKRKFHFEKAEEFLKCQQDASGDPAAIPPPESCPDQGGDAGTNQTVDKEESGTERVVTSGAVTDEDLIKLRPCEKKKVEFRGKLYLAPLTTCGNLPFRRICKRYGADITCGEMAMCTNLLQGHSSEWALVKRHHTEDIFGVQLEGGFPDTMTKCAEVLNTSIDVDFVDINVGCPIDLVYNKGGGCGLMTRVSKFESIVKGMNTVLDVPVTVKIRTGVQEKNNLAHKLIPQLRDWGVSMITLHGRSREQRYTRLADWDYIGQCADIADPLPLFGNGDIFSFEDANRAMATGVSGIMLARGALVKPWLFTEIKEQRHWDISSSERFSILQDYSNYGLEHWGSDTEGVEKTRRFMLEWLSFLCRYIPVGLLERLPQKINERPPYYMGRDYLETLMASQNVGDWIKISEMLLGPVPQDFTFLPKHKANSYK